MAVTLFSATRNPGTYRTPAVSGSIASPAVDVLLTPAPTPANPLTVFFEETLNGTTWRQTASCQLRETIEPRASYPGGPVPSTAAIFTVQPSPGAVAWRFGFTLTVRTTVTATRP